MHAAGVSHSQNPEFLKLHKQQGVDHSSLFPQLPPARPLHLMLKA